MFELKKTCKYFKLVLVYNVNGLNMIHIEKKMYLYVLTYLQTMY